MKKIVLGILAHVDAGKTTLAEAMLYISGTIKKQGRVDNRDAFFDTDKMERERGITIFSKQAEIDLEETSIMLLDTPGHTDFSSEMERTLQVLDYAVLVVSGKDGIQGHTVTLWRLLEEYDIPVFIFVNKMDMPDTDRQNLLNNLKESFGEGCVDFSDGHPDEEELALCSEDMLETYMEGENIDLDNIRSSIKTRKAFPVYFGSALKLSGVKELLSGLDMLTYEKGYGSDFEAKVYKISYDEQGTRLTHMKITGGKLNVKDQIEIIKRDDKKEEKINQIRIYSGEKFRAVNSACAGEVCAVTGPVSTYEGQGLGKNLHNNVSVLKPALTYSVIPQEGSDVYGLFLKLKKIGEEDPQLNITWDSELGEIQMQLMGEVQLEILKALIFRRFGIKVDFSSGKVAYRETISDRVVGSGHFEPLRHYAEVHLLMEPGPRGSGIRIGTLCSEDDLDANWQKLIISHIGEKEHKGVLTASPVTDIKISLIGGKAHSKHTEGGDFRQATYRAVRQGLMKARSVLLEPWYEFRLEVPSEMTGRAISDVQKMGGNTKAPEMYSETTVLNGRAPVSEMKDYAVEVASYTKGYGNLTCVFCGYDVCHDQQEVIEAADYDAEGDPENTGDSVFCANGAGFRVPWDESDGYMHVRVGVKEDREDVYKNVNGAAVNERKSKPKTKKEEDEELERIFEMTYGKRKERRVIGPKTIEAEKVKIKPAEVKQEYFLVDGYNIIFAWDRLKELANKNLDSAREALLEILSNFQSYRGCKMKVVFDAYKISGGIRHYENYDNIDVVFTKEAETADTYIEKTASELSKQYLVRVATSDNLEQMMVWGGGAFRMSALELKAEIENTDREIDMFIEKHNRKNKMENRRGIKIPEQNSDGDDKK